MNSEIYLDNSATTQPYEEVAEYITHINRFVYGNPSSMHTKGFEAEKIVSKSREIIASSIGVENKEIIFTSGGTESNNLAIRGYLEANHRKGKHIITSKIEHPSVLEVYKHLGTQGYKVEFLDVDDQGIVRLEQLENAINNETALISLIYVNNEVGTIQPIEEIVKIRNKKNSNTVIHIDAVQAYGKIKILPKKLGVDMLSFSSHKIHGPKGCGALYASKSVKIKPIVYGGGQEALMRSGTENVSGIGGFGLAAQFAIKNLDENYNKVEGLRKLFHELLEDKIGNCKINSPSCSLPYISNISFPDVKSEVLLHHLEERNIFVSTGSACSSRKNIHSHVLKAMGLKSTEIDGAIRFSFSHINDESQILETIKGLSEILPVIKINRGGKK